MPDATLAHLSDFVATRRGVEAWVEQPTSFNRASILLVAADGESTRRGLPSADVGYHFADDHGDEGAEEESAEEREDHSTVRLRDWQSE